MSRSHESELPDYQILALLDLSTSWFSDRSDCFGISSKESLQNVHAANVTWART
jgi:hypothetical protein